MRLEIDKSSVIGIVITIAIVYLGLFFSNLYSSVSLIFTISVVVVMLATVVASSALASHFSKTKYEKELENIVNKLYKIISSIEKREGFIESGLFLSTEDFLNEEAIQKEVWIVVEDFDPTDGSIWTENIKKNILNGVNYVIFLSSQKTVSAIGFVTNLTKRNYKNSLVK
jgi:hypothetical protein